MGQPATHELARRLRQRMPSSRGHLPEEFRGRIDGEHLAPVVATVNNRPLA
jgi:hypothetical protein